MTNVQTVNMQLSPLLSKQLGVKPRPQDTQNSTTADNRTEIVAVSPLLAKSILAQQKQILSPQNIKYVETPASRRVEGYHNNLKNMMIHNEANIIAVILRTMNAKDEDGNELIQGNEKKGNFVSDVERLDELKDLGFNCQHVLPIHPPGKINAMGTAGSIYAPLDFLTLDPELVDENPPEEARRAIEKNYEEKTGRKLVKMDKNDPEVAFAQCKYYVDECHKRGIKLLLDLPSCGSLDFAQAHRDMIAMGADGKEKTPGGWQDIRMLQPFENEEERTLNQPVLDMHKKYVDMAIDLGFDGIRADVGRAKPVEFWNIIIRYSHLKDSQFAWLAETYTHEDASPQLNMPYDRPEDLLEAGFDSYYGQYHIISDWTKANQLYSYVKENIDLNNKIGRAKSLIGSMATHDDVSPMLYGGAPWVMYTTTLQSMLPQVNFYMPDGVQTGDFYMPAYDGATVEESATDSNECFVHTGRMDIFNNGRKPGGDFPEIADVVKTALSLRNNDYNKVNANSGRKLSMENSKDVITRGSFIILPTNNPEIVAFARHKDGKTLLFVGNRNVNKRVGGTIEIPGLRPNQKFNNLMPKYGQECKFQNNQDGTINVELGLARACVFEIDDTDIEKLSKPENVYQQKYLRG